MLGFLLPGYLGVCSAVETYAELKRKQENPNPPFIPTWRILWWPDNGPHVDKIVKSPNIHLVSSTFDNSDGHGSVLPTKESCEFFDVNPGEKEKAYAPLPPYPEYEEDLQLLRELPAREWIPLGGKAARAPGPTWEDTKTLSRLLLHLLESR